MFVRSVKNRVLFVVCFLIGMVSLCAEEISYERTLKAFEVESDEIGLTVHFLLDNDWIFKASVPAYEEHKIFGLSKLVGVNAYIDTYYNIKGLVLTLENPSQSNHPKISFSGSFSRECYDQLLTVESIDFSDYIIFSTATITLSDGSIWRMQNKDSHKLVAGYWSVGDHVVISKNFERYYDTWTLVNLDVSGTYWINCELNEKGKSLCSVINPRSVEVY